MIAAEQKKVLAERIVLLDESISLLNQRISGFQSKDSVNEKIIISYQSEIAVMKEQRVIFEGAIAERDREIKKLKRKVFWSSTIGLAGIATLGVLYLTK